jgi:hypothetical protein
MTVEELKAEVRGAPPEVRAEIYTLLGALRRAQQPGRAQTLASRLDDPTRWVSEEDAAKRLGLEADGRE